MWLFTDHGMYSAVEDKLDPTVIVVRARVHKDLEELRKRCPDASKIIVNGGTDYPYRVRLSRAAWARFVSLAAVNIDYTNFKDSVTAKQGRRRHDVYLRVWGVLLGMETRRSARRRGHRRGQQPLDAALDADPGTDAWWDRDDWRER